MIRNSLGALMLVAAPSALTAQGTQPLPGQPSDAYHRTTENAGNERALDAPGEQLRRGVEQAMGKRAAEAARKGGRPRPAKADEIVAGAAVADSAGSPVGTIETVAAEGAVVATAAGKVKVPLEAFGKNRNGLLLGISKDEFDKVVAGANASAAR